MDREMMKALEQDAAMLEAMGAGEQPLAFYRRAMGMRLINAEKGLWLVYDQSGQTIASGLTLDQADRMMSQ